MKSYFLTIVMIVLGVLCHAQEYDVKGTKVNVQSYSFENLDGENYFKLDNVNGDIELEGWDRPEVQVQYNQFIYADSDANLEEARNVIGVVCKSSGNKIFCYVNAPDINYNEDECAYIRTDLGSTYGQYSYEHDFKVMVPKNTNIVVRNISGNIKNVQNIKANIVKVKNVSGGLKMEDIQGTKVLASTVSGNLHLHEISSETLEAYSTSGNIILDGVSGIIRSNTISGNIVIKYTENPNGYSDIQTKSGNIDMSFEDPIQGLVGYHIEMTGRFFNDTDLEVSPDVGIQNYSSCGDKKSDYKNKKLEGKRQSSNEFILQTSTGNIYLRYL